MGYMSNKRETVLTTPLGTPTSPERALMRTPARSISGASLTRSTAYAAAGAHLAGLR